jgi:asparagine synthase (glutamine-hydrolysing)
MPDGLQRRLRHSFLEHPDTFEKIYFDNFYSVFPQSQQPQVFTTELMDEVGDGNAYANSMQFFPITKGNSNLLNRLLYLDMKTYLVELLMKQDQMSMAASIESRVPFLDHKLVEFAAHVPAQYKIRYFSGKHLLRRAMEKRLPGEVLRRNKKGFPTPIRPWLQNQLYGQLSAILASGRMAERRLINPAYVQSLLDAHRRGDPQATEGCWRLLNFELWHQIFLDRDSSWRSAQAQCDHALVSA